MSTISKLGRDKSGQVAILFALSIIPIVAVAGFAIDFQQTVKRKAKVQLVMDSAVLAAARVKQTGASNDEIKLTVQQFMDAQIGNLGGLDCDPTTVLVTENSEEIDASILCEQTTALIKVVGRDEMPFRVSSASEYGIDKVDVAFMFDVSGSMNSSNRLVNLKAAAKEAIDVLLPAGAPSELIEDTRLAMVSYNSMVNAGDFFPEVAGVPATRTYEHTIQPIFTEDDLTEGSLFDEMHIGLYDTDTGNLISEIGDGAKIKIEDWQDDDLTIAVTLNSSHDLYGDVESMRMQLRGTEYKNKNENGEPYALYGGSGIGYGEAWDMGDFTIRLRAYSENDREGTKLFDETIAFSLALEDDLVPQEKSYTLTSTCVWERDGADKFSDANPVSGGYLSHRQAWFVEDDGYSGGGYWEVGHPNRPDNSTYDGDECRDHDPVELTNNRTTLNNYVDSLTAGGWTAGHLGVAWTWYLVAEDWKTIFDGDAAPLSYSEPDSAKAVILMTDGSFNAEIYPEQGDSDAQARDLCDSMKAKDVKVYAVALNAPTAGKEVLSYCATGTDYYFEPETAAELTEAYQKIATSISDLRISR
ncbi:MAG: pilus assembly protein TadG-related protein [Hyphomonas sp.]|jgi:Flp pilus assembly protein TadG|nr:pilus assembly protein TadG-related protein [Hyphomonas sp.]